VEEEPLTGVVRKQEIPITQEQLDAWEAGVLIHRAMPSLNCDQREFVMTGVIFQEWGLTTIPDAVAGPLPASPNSTRHP
jgi:hypothetical protein